jgi:predicted nucleic acid-binding protein
MSDPAFFDTNVLLYMYDRRDARKRRISAETFRSRLEAGSIVISTQVVQEFYVSVTRKLRLPSREARALAVDLCELPLIVLEAGQILRALDLEGHFRISFWDALILAAAEAAGARTLFSEDFTHGRTYGEIQVVNPFLAA